MYYDSPSLTVIGLLGIDGGEVLYEFRKRVGCGFKYG
jgi:xanthosine utilization system XapX-like protein